MLKDRLRKWDRGKNIKSHEMKAIDRQLTTREAAHKRSEIYIRGTTVPIAKVKRYRRPDGSTLRNEVSLIKSPISPVLEIRTPPPSPLSLPRSLGIPEELIRCIRDYIFGAFEEGIWFSIGDSDFLKSKEGALCEAFEFQANVDLALTLFDSDRFSDAERSLSRAEADLESAIRKQDSQMIPCALTCVQQISLPKYGKSMVLGNGMPILSMVECWSSMAIEILGYDHPLARSMNLLYWFSKEAENTSLLTGIERIWISTLDSIKLVLDPLHVSMLEYRVLYIRDVLVNRDPEHALSILRQLQRNCDEKCRGLGDVRPSLLRLHLADMLYAEKCGQFEEAITVATDVIERTRQPDFLSRSLHHYQSEAYRFLGFAQKNLGRDVLAEQAMRKAIQIRSEKWGAQDAKRLEFMMVLESWLRERGKLEAADKIREEWQMAMGCTSDDEDSDA